MHNPEWSRYEDEEEESRLMQFVERWAIPFSVSLIINAAIMIPVFIKVERAFGWMLNK